MKETSEAREIREVIEMAIALYAEGDGWCALSQRMEREGQTFRSIEGALKAAAKRCNRNPDSALSFFQHHLSKIAPTVRISGKEHPTTIQRYEIHVMANRFFNISKGVGRDFALMMLTTSLSKLEGERGHI